MSSAQSLHEAYSDSVTRPKGRTVHKDREVDRSGIEGKKVITGAHHQANLVRKQQMLMSTQGQEEEQQESKEKTEEARQKNNSNFLKQLMHFKASREAVNEALNNSDSMKTNQQQFLADIAKGLDPERMAKLHNLTDKQQLGVATFVLEHQARKDSQGKDMNSFLAKKLGTKESEISEFGDDNIFVKWAKEHGIQDNIDDEKLVFMT